jgi:hypothetical protein
MTLLDRIIAAQAPLDYNAVAECGSFTRVHSVAAKIAGLIQKAPAGGLFHDAKITVPVSTTNGNVSGFEVTNGDGKRYHVIVEAAR